MNHRALIVLGSKVGVNVTFWRIPWTKLETDPRERRFVIAPVKDSPRVLVASPREFVDTVMHGARANFMETASWQGDTAWARREGKGGGYMQSFKTDRLQNLVRDRQDFLETLGPEVDVVEQEGEAVDIRRTSTSRLRELLQDASSC